ncbi:MAG: hypothetical protein JSU90_04905, partial [Nitrospiraceae bacterium]
MSDISYVRERIENKRRDYRDYDFSYEENDALKTFFDLAQEFDDMEDFYTLCVAVPRSYFSLDACLYVIDAEESHLSLVARTGNERYALFSKPPEHIRPAAAPYCTDDNVLVLTIRGKALLMEQLPFKVEDDVLGLLTVYPVGDVTEHRKLFFQKYANRIGFNIHNRLLVRKNIEHLKFIRSLVADIEHNIIVPNMVYKLFLRGLKRKIEKNIELEREFMQKSSAGLCDAECLNNFVKDFSDVNSGLSDELQNLQKHYKNMSLFIETLFRKSHFDQGRLSVRTKPCNMKIDVVQPQLDRYIEQLRKMGIAIDDRFSGIPDSEIITVVDVGL